METIEIKVPCEIHGLEILVSEGGKDYCEECMVERVEKQIEGYSMNTIARWIFKNSGIDANWWTIFRYAQLYHIEEVDGVTFNDEFYAGLKEKKERMRMLDGGAYLKSELDREEY